LVRKKRTKRQILVKKLDDITSKIVRARDEACVQCGTTENLTNGHVFSRRHNATRWDISLDGNCHCQCWGCNYKHSYDNYEYYKWYQDKFGLEAFEDLRARYTTTCKFSIPELEEMYEKYSELYKEIK
jgi:hypothetical protein